MRAMHRQVLSLVYGLAVTGIAVLALRQGSNPTVIISIVGMSMLTLMLIFGVEIDSVRILDHVEIKFSESAANKQSSEQSQDQK